MASVNFATEEKNDAKPVWERYVSEKKFPCLRHKEAVHKHTKQASAAKKNQNEQKKTKIEATLDNIADILLADGENWPVRPAPLRFPDCPSNHGLQFHVLALTFNLPRPYRNAMQEEVQPRELGGRGYVGLARAATSVEDTR